MIPFMPSSLVSQSTGKFSHLRPAKQEHRKINKLRIPQTAVFRDGILKVWYFSGAGGKVRRKDKKNLEKSVLLREFIKEAKPGRPIALLVCSEQVLACLSCTFNDVQDPHQKRYVVVH